MREPWEQDADAWKGDASFAADPWHTDAIAYEWFIVPAEEREAMERTAKAWDDLRNAATEAAKSILALADSFKQLKEKERDFTPQTWRSILPNRYQERRRA